MRIPIILLPLFLSLSSFAGVHSQAHDRNEQQIIEDSFDCANSTHQWQSENGSCFDESGVIPLRDRPIQQSNGIGRFLGGIGLTPRNSLCGPDQTSCWVVNCCEPGEICGDITVGCIIAWSTIYTTTIGTMWSTITMTMTPSLSSTTTILQTSTEYVSKTTDITIPGAGTETIYQTSSTTTTELILSAATPTASTLFSTITSTVVRDLNTANTLPASITASPNVKKLGNIEKRIQRTSYTTLTVYVTRFSSATTTTTYTGSVGTVTQMIYATVTNVQTNQHYSTNLGFTTVTVNYTSTYSSYAFGTLDTPTLTILSTRMLTSDSASSITPSSILAAAGEPTDTALNTPTPSSTRKRLSAGAIAGIVIAILALFVLIALAILCCCCRRRNAYGVSKDRRGSVTPVTPPLLPEPPIPQPAMAVVDNNRLQRPAPAANNLNGYTSRAGRKSSRSSIVSISPVPEEADEDEYNSSSPENGVGAPMTRRDSSDSTRSWGRGFGGRGGYGAHGRGGAVYSGNGNGSPGGNRQFRGVMTSTYPDGNLVPPHER